MARYRPGRETRARIIDATRSLLGEAGFEGTTLKAICSRADVLPGSFYNLFTSKDEIVLEVVREAITAVDPHPASDEPDTLDDLIAAYIRFITDDPVPARIYLQFAFRAGVGDEAWRARILRHHARRVERFAGAYARLHPGAAQADARDAAEDLLATLNGLALRWLLDPSFSFRKRASKLLVDSGSRAPAVD